MDTTIKTPFFSIILPVFNGERSIAETIESVIQQSFTGWELIIIDDGSTDGSANIVRGFCALDSRVKLLQQANKKQAAARNNGLNVASGKWIAFIDADDLWLPSKLQLQHQFISNNAEVDVVFTDGYTKFHDKRIRHYYHYPIVHGFFKGADLYRKMLFGNYIPILSVVVKSSWVLKVGPQDETVPGVEDHDYWLRLCRAGANFYGMEERLFVYNVHDTNFSSNQLNQRYISSIIRVKNFDAQLLNNEEIREFREAVKQYLKYFQQQDRSDLVQDIKAKFLKLNLPTPSVTEVIRHMLLAVKYKCQSYAYRIKSRLWVLLLKVIYFYPKKKFADYKDRIDTYYTNWLNRREIRNTDSIFKRKSAQINFFNNDGSKFDVQRIYIGDYSIINFLAENSMIIAGADVNVGKFCNFNVVGQLVMGNNVLFNNHSTLTCHEEIVIGDNSWFGEGVRLYDHSHKYKDPNLPFTQQGYSHGKIEIGNNVWVGSNSIILQNVTIGDGCVIGANNVIYKSLPPNTIVKSRSMDQIDIINK